MNILDGLAPHHRAVLDLVREIARARALSPFLVGGPVRDLVFGLHPSDLDFSIEKGAKELASDLATRLGATFSGPTRFLTFKVSGPGCGVIDFATARRERYNAPGALPDVEPATLEDDLWRRDFSINAIAIGVLDGKVADPTGGLSDLSHRMIRVLHGRSFIDDPTRIARAIRFSCRLSFRIEAGTMERIGEAIRQGSMETISQDRLWREFVSLTLEAESVEPISLAVATGVFAPIAGIVDPTTLRKALRRAVAAARLESSLDREAMLTAAMVGSSLDPAAVLGRIPVSRDRTNLIREISGAEELAAELSRMDGRRDQLRRVTKERPERVACAEAGWPGLDGLTSDLFACRRLEIGVRGDELGVPPGPHVGEALEAAREALFFGDIPSDEVRSFAKEAALQYLRKQT